MSQYRDITLVLDGTTIRAFADGTGSLAVGEALTEVEEDSGLVALPPLCLAEAFADLDDPTLLELLVDHPTTVVLDLPAEGWRPLAAMLGTVPLIGSASAVLTAIDHDALLLTRDPEPYAKIAGGGPLIIF